METETATWLCVLKYKILELSAGILRLSLQGRFLTDRRSLVQVQSEQYSAENSDRTSLTKYHIFLLVITSPAVT